MASSRFLRFLVGTGVAAVIVIAFPVTAVFGLLLGILPGLILGITPSLFIYLVVWWGLQWLVLKFGMVAGLDSTTRQVRWMVNLVPLAVVLVVAFKLPAAINAPLEQEIAQLQATDAQPPGVIKLPAIVAIELPSSSHTGRRGEGPYCEALCLRLLYNGAVARVIAAARFPDGKKIELASYRIERRDQCPKPDLPRTLIVWPEQHLALRGTKPRRVEDRVQARISAGECLVRDAGRIEDAEAIISVRTVKVGTDIFQGSWNPWIDTVGARRLEILEAGGRVLYRRTEVTAALLSIPLRSTAGGGLLTSVTYVGWARSRADTLPLGPDARDILPGLLGEEATRPPDVPDTARP
ncbi:hypothetical protein IVB30_30510 [Bradyrhizobium sp. 200]|uniref:hypothetical protein n=1 Tax=Bradyrhizobium sp. 200 TaxID=2782665 RepID=UPI001FFED2A2|nr:hypothetical protein [Bradyrhizobium sp. 200]UPJ47573.1 hypothetical protein IVB30_30510 [Bradyrhizobium sp. 200]